MIEFIGAISEKDLAKADKDTIAMIKSQAFVRCRDCKWFGNIGCAISIVDESDKPTETDYCSFAERRTDE